MVDARYLDGTTKGIGRYTEYLLRGLLDIDDRLRLHLITHPKRPQPIDDDRVRCQPFGADPSSLSTRFVLSRCVDFSGVDLFHSPFGFLPATLPVPAVTTIHDIMWLVDSSLFTPGIIRRLVTGTYYRTFMPRAVRQASAVLTVSHHSRRAIEERFPDAAGRVDVTYNGVDPFFRPQPPEEAWPKLSKWLAPKSPFVLVVGQGSPYKNHPGAARGFVEAFGDDPEVYFVMVRRPKTGRTDTSELNAVLDDPRLNSRVIRLDYVSGPELRALYSMARAFLFPSLYEGFGLPALEAMACNTPVVTSDFGATAEVCGEAAALVDPEEPGEIASALRRLLYNDEYHDKMQRRARKRADQFSWRHCARQTLKTYRRILSQSGVL